MQQSSDEPVVQAVPNLDNSHKSQFSLSFKARLEAVNALLSTNTMRLLEFSTSRLEIDEEIQMTPPVSQPRDSS